jgi:hypothetical protein
VYVIGVYVCHWADVCTRAYVWMCLPLAVSLCASLYTQTRHTDEVKVDHAILGGKGSWVPIKHVRFQELAHERVRIAALELTASFPISPRQTQTEEIGRPTDRKLMYGYGP